MAASAASGTNMPLAAMLEKNGGPSPCGGVPDESRRAMVMMMGMATRPAQPT